MILTYDVLPGGLMLGWSLLVEICKVCKLSMTTKAIRPIAIIGTRSHV